MHARRQLLYGLFGLLQFILARLKLVLQRQRFLLCICQVLLGRQHEVRLLRQLLLELLVVALLRHHLLRLQLARESLLLEATLSVIELHLHLLQLRLKLRNLGLRLGAQSVVAIVVSLLR